MGSSSSKKKKDANINIIKQEQFAILNHKTEQKNSPSYNLPDPPSYEDQKIEKESLNKNPYPSLEPTIHQQEQNSAIKENIKKMYDIIFACESIDKLLTPGKGWEYYYTDTYKNLIEDKKNEKYSKIGFIGETNKGKTFILNQLTKNQLKWAIQKTLWFLPKLKAIRKSRTKCFLSSK